MKDKKPPDLSALVNNSGFPFQLGVEHEIQTNPSPSNNPWAVLTREHPWKHPDTGENGFIDLIAHRGCYRLVIECKRSRDADWAFLVPQDQRPTATRIRSRWMRIRSEWENVNAIDDLHWLPPSYESAFCAVRGQGESHTPMLENLSNTLLASLDSLSQQDLTVHRSHQWRNLFVYVPVIVTTARLNVCLYDPGRVSLTTGETDGLTFETVSAVRFRKSLTTSLPEDGSLKGLEDCYAASERTVFIVSAPNLPSVLAELDNKRPKYGKFPWEKEY
jgi:hypothetical protein